VPLPSTSRAVPTQVKTKETDGYSAVQVGYKQSKEKHINKPELGHLAKAGVEPMRHLAEWRVRCRCPLALTQPAAPFPATRNPLHEGRAARWDKPLLAMAEGSPLGGPVGHGHAAQGDRVGAHAVETASRRADRCETRAHADGQDGSRGGWDAVQWDAPHGPTVRMFAMVWA
jgi:hypothetical protein